MKLSNGRFSNDFGNLYIFVYMQYLYIPTTTTFLHGRKKGIKTGRDRKAVESGQDEKGDSGIHGSQQIVHLGSSGSVEISGGARGEMISTISAWNLIKDTKLLRRVQEGTQGVTWKFSEDEWNNA